AFSRPTPRRHAVPGRHEPSLPDLEMAVLDLRPLLAALRASDDCMPVGWAPLVTVASPGAAAHRRAPPNRLFRRLLCLFCRNVHRGPARPVWACSVLGLAAAHDRGWCAIAGALCAPRHSWRSPRACATPHPRADRARVVCLARVR